MKHKTIAMIALAMILVFGTITLVYPMIFNPDTNPAMDPVTAPPVAAPPVIK